MKCFPTEQQTGMDTGNIKARMRMKAGLTFAFMNLKKLAKMLQRIGKIGPGGPKYMSDISFAVA